jgi:hypothetical protein
LKILNKIKFQKKIEISFCDLTNHFHLFFLFVIL